MRGQGAFFPSTNMKFGPSVQQRGRLIYCYWVQHIDIDVLDAFGA